MLHLSNHLYPARQQYNTAHFHEHQHKAHVKLNLRKICLPKHLRDILIKLTDVLLDECLCVLTDRCVLHTCVSDKQVSVPSIWLYCFSLQGLCISRVDLSDCWITPAPSTETAGLQYPNTISCQFITLFLVANSDEFV